MANMPNINDNAIDEKKQDIANIPVVNKKRGPYNNLMTPARKLTIAKLAYDVGVTRAIAQYSDWNVKWSSAKDWMTKYKLAKEELGSL